MNQSPFRAKLLAVLHRVFLAFFYLLLRATVGFYCRMRFRPKYDRPKNVARLRPPYVVLADHVHPMDMFINGLALRPVIHWVAADANFRTPFMKFVMTALAGAVAKSKNRSDMVTLSKLRILTEVGCVIGIYQEGERSWDGVGLPPVPGTDKLIRFLKIPVVYAHLHGAYLEHPRWSWSGNRTAIRVRYELLIDSDEVKTMPLSEITRRITEAGRYDEWNYQAGAREPLRGEQRAENVELVCFTCPECREVGTIRSEGNDFHCTECGLSGSIDRFGSFEWSRPADPKPADPWPADPWAADPRAGAGTGKPFANVREWNLWQMEHYGAVIDRLYGAGDAPPGGTASPSRDAALPSPAGHLFWEDRNRMNLSRGYRAHRMEDLGTGTARLFGDRIEFESADDFISMPLADITGFSVFKQYYAEFYYEKHLYRFTGIDRSVSGYKWLLLFRMIAAKTAG